MSAFSSGTRIAALLLMGALVLHQLRYLFGYREGSGGALAEQGHTYLGAVVAPVLVVLLALAAGQLVRSFLRPRGSRPAAAGSFRRRWALAAVALLAIYTSQELTEGLLSPGHPAGIAGVLGHGGWIAIALAVPLGAGIALLLRAAEALIAHREGGTSPSGRGDRSPAVPRRPEYRRSLDPVARHLAGRAPPLLSSW